MSAMIGKPAKYQRSGIVIVGALVLLVVLLGWRAASLIGPQDIVNAGASSSTVSGKQFLVYRTYTVLDRGQKDWPNNDAVEYDFIRYPLDGAAVSERLAKVTTVDAGGSAAAPWMTQISKNLMLFSHSTDSRSADQAFWVDVSGDQVQVPDTSGNVFWSGHPSPDGSIIVYTDRDKKIVSVLTKADGLTRSYSTKGLDDSGYLLPDAWDPDGRTVYLVPVSEGQSFTSGLWKLDTTTGKIDEVDIVRKLGISNFTLSLETHKLAGSTFTCESLDRCGVGPSDLYVIDLTTGDAIKVLSDPVLAYTRPLISPDGTKIAYTFNNDGGNVHVVDSSDPTSDRRLLSGSAVAWTPDGRRLVMDRDNELQLFDIATGAVTTVVRRVGTYQDPDFRGVDFIGIVEKR